MVVRNGNADAVAQAIHDKKAPGIGTWGSTTASAVDAEGNEHPVSFTRYQDKNVYIYLFIRLLEGGDAAAAEAAVKPAVFSYVNGLGLAEPLNIPRLYGVGYAADPALARTFIITDIQVSAIGAGAMARDIIECAWNQKITAPPEIGVDITFT